MHIKREMATRLKTCLRVEDLSEILGWHCGHVGRYCIKRWVYKGWLAGLNDHGYSGSCCGDGHVALGEVGYAAHHDGAIWAGDVGMEIGTIGRISSLGLEVLFGYRHDESVVFGWKEVVLEESGWDLRVVLVGNFGKEDDGCSSWTLCCVGRVGKWIGHSRHFKARRGRRTSQAQGRKPTHSDTGNRKQPLYSQHAKLPPI